MTNNSLGIDLPIEKTRVVVAMSGGVDSSVVAGLLKEEGYDVVGITLQLYDHGDATRTKGACCAGADIHDARRVAGKLGVKHFVLDYESRFKAEVMDDFADSYLRGETPIPCVRCNQTVKFRDLLTMAKDLEASCLATGHYVRREVRGTQAVLLRGTDAEKDQSYFLFATTAEQLSYLRFPLGGMDKKETRSHAKRLGLDVADKADSQDICFVPNGRYGDVVRRLRPGADKGGDIVLAGGEVIGKHKGIIDYTIGQRRGLGIGGRADSEGRLYVVGIRPEAHEVIVGEKDLLACSSVVIGEVNWLYGEAPSLGQEVLVKLRHAGDAVLAEVVGWGNGAGELKLKESQYGIASGQAAALYSAKEPELLLGGGWIVSAPTAYDEVKVRA